MVVVSNATPIITMASIDKIEIFKEFFKNIYIPRAVYDEIKAKKAFGFDEIDDSFFIVKDIKNSFAQDVLLCDLDLGEAQTIVLAKELNADIVIIDEIIGYNIARQQNLNVKRTLSFLVAYKKVRKIEYIKPLLDDMIKNGRWISKRVYKEILKLCYESL